MRRHSQETKNEVLKLWNANVSSNNISIRLGITRNSVISLINRMRAKGIKVRQGDIKQPYKNFKRKYYKKKVSSEVPKLIESQLSVKISKERWVPLLHLENNTCRYTKDGKLFCNAPSKGSWCDEHAKIMFSPHAYRLYSR